MKQRKGKSKPKNLRSVWVKNGVDIRGKDIDALIVEVPDAPKSRIKASVTEMKEQLSHISEELVEHGKPAKVGKKKKKALKREKNKLEKELKREANILKKEKKADTSKLKKEERMRAPVHNITDGKKLHSVTSETSETSSIAKLEEVIKQDDIATASNEERTIVGPPKPVNTSASMPKKDSVKGSVAEGYDCESNTSHVSVRDDVWIKGGIGSSIRNTGVGMSPSGRPLSEFSSGGKYAFTGTMDTKCWETMFPRDYTYDELGAQNDALKLALHKQATAFGKRIGALNAQISGLNQHVDEHNSKVRVKEFNAAHLSKGEGAVPKGFDEQQNRIIDLETENNYLCKDVTDLRDEVSKLSDFIEQLERHVIYDAPVSGEVSVNSKPPMKTLGQYNQHKYVKDSVADSPQLEIQLRPLMDVGSQASAPKSEVKKDTPSRAVRMGAPVNQYHKLHSVTLLDNFSNKIKKSDESYSMFEYYPSARALDSKEYCKVWEGFNMLTLDFHMNEHLVAQTKTKTHMIVKPILKGIKAVKDVMDYELNPSTRKDNEASRVKRELERQAEEAVPSAMKSDIAMSRKAYMDKMRKENDRGKANRAKAREGTGGMSEKEVNERLAAEFNR